MKNFKTYSRLLAFCLVIALSSCTYRLVDFTVISSKNAEIGVDRTKGVSAKGSKGYFLGFGWNIKDAMDRALEEAGSQYDLLIDGVVTYSSYPFVVVVKVKGLAVSSRDLRASLGEEGYNDWVKNHDIFDPENAVVVEE